MRIQTFIHFQSDVNFLKQKAPEPIKGSGAFTLFLYEFLPYGDGSFCGDGVYTKKKQPFRVTFSVLPPAPA